MNANWITALIYFIGFVSVIGIVTSTINVKKVRERLRISQEIRLERYNSKWLDYKLMKKYHFLMSSTIKRYEIEHFSKIVIIQFTSFLSLFILFFITIRETNFSLFASFLFAYLLPIGFMYMRFKHAQAELQEDIIEVSAILLQEYQKSHEHMVYALKGVVNRTSGKSQIAYARLFARMHDDDDMKNIAAENFAFQLGHFGKNLASIILRACKDGIPVTRLLEELVTDITEFNKRVRDGKTEARETALLGYAPIVLLIGLFFFNLNSLPDGRALEYQFQTAAGLKSFTVALIASLVCVALAIIVYKPRRG